MNTIQPKKQAMANRPEYLDLWDAGLHSESIESFNNWKKMSELYPQDWHHEAIEGFEKTLNETKIIDIINQSTVGQNYPNPSN
jgi:hypothetical protein